MCVSSERSTYHIPTNEFLIVPKRATKDVFWVSRLPVELEVAIKGRERLYNPHDNQQYNTQTR